MDQVIRGVGGDNCLDLVGAVGKEWVGKLSGENKLIDRPRWVEERDGVMVSPHELMTMQGAMLQVGNWRGESAAPFRIS